MNATCLNPPDVINHSILFRSIAFSTYTLWGGCAAHTRGTPRPALEGAETGHVQAAS